MGELTCGRCSGRDRRTRSGMMRGWAVVVGGIDQLYIWTESKWTAREIAERECGDQAAWELEPRVYESGEIKVGS